LLLAQSNAIERLIAKRIGLAGANDLESAQIDELMDYIADFLNGKYNIGYLVLQFNLFRQLVNQLHIQKMTSF